MVFKSWFFFLTWGPSNVFSFRLADPDMAFEFLVESSISREKRDLKQKNFNSLKKEKRIRDLKQKNLNSLKKNNNRSGTKSIQNKLQNFSVFVLYYI